MDASTAISLLGLGIAVLGATLGSAWRLATRIGAVQGEVREGFARLHGELGTLQSRLGAAEADLSANREAHGRLHSRLDDHGERIVRVETVQGFSGGRP